MANASLERLCLVTDSAGPFSRTHEAARKARAAMSGYGAVHREGFSRPSAVAEKAQTEAVSVDRGQLGRLAFNADDRPYRQQTPRSRLPRLLTATMVVALVQVLWSTPVDRLPVSQAAHQELSPSASNPPPKAFPNPLEVAEPPKPIFKPR